VLFRSWLAGGAVITGSLLALGASRLFGRRGSRPAALISVLSGWLGAWVLWSFVGGLAASHGVLDTYDGSWFALLALVGGFWQYRTQVQLGRERGLAVFVAGQLVWLAVVLVRNGVLSP